MNKSFARRPQGFVLLPVVLAITLIAAIAFLINRESAIQVNMAAGETQVSQAEYVAEAGFQHTNWQIQQTNCSGYTDLATTAFGSDSYSATITDAAGNPLTTGSPVKISAIGTLANGTSRSLARDNVKVYQTPTTTVTLQPDASSAKDTYLYEWKSGWNYGIAVDLWVDERFTDSTANGLIEFDLGSIPAQAKVINATLALYQKNPSLAGGPVDVYRMTSVWTEGTKSGGNGSPNWIESDIGISWANVGGDYDATLAATTTISASTLDWFNWDITKLVDGWVAGKYQNYGLALVAQSFGTAAHFHSSDYTDPVLRPKLTISYACECGLVCTPAGPAGESITLTPSQDTQIRESTSFSYGSEVDTALTDDDFEVRPLLQFDVSSLASGSTVISAYLRLYQSTVISGGSMTGNAYRVIEEWDEAWDGSGGANWDNRFKQGGSTLQWTDPGVTYDDGWESQTTFDASVSDQWVEWDLSPLVQQWIDGVSPNYGVVILPDTVGPYAIFSSSDSGDSAFHPELVIEYTSP